MKRLLKYCGLQDKSEMALPIDSECYNPNGVNVGKNVSFIPPVNFGSEPYLITIGDNTTISFDVAFVTHDAATRVLRNLPEGDKEVGFYGEIVIGSNCFVGCRTTILGNVHIGDNTIIGAGSVVNKDIPSNVVAAGNPCRVICSLDEYIKKHKERGDFTYIQSYNPEQKKIYLLEHIRTK